MFIKIPQSDFSSIPPLYVPTKEYKNTMDKKIRIEAIKFHISISKEMNDFTYE